MNKKEMIGEVPSKLLGMLEDLMVKLRKGVLTLEQLGLFLQKKNPFVTVDNLISDWEKFYQGVFNIKVDFSNLKIPGKIKGFDRLIIIIPGMTPQILFDKCKKLFPCWKYTNDDLDKIVTSKRTAVNGPYAIWIRDRQEADEELKNLSANQLKKKRIPGITLEERLLYELKFFQETGKHLDINNITLCAGSVDSGGRVLGVRWCVDKMGVSWYSPADSHSFLRSRLVVS